MLLLTNRKVVTVTQPITTMVTTFRTSLTTSMAESAKVNEWRWFIAPECCAWREKASIDRRVQFGLLVLYGQRSASEDPLPVARTAGSNRGLGG
nr:hypothetical protein CFP56_01402 [Quercus suber]